MRPLFLYFHIYIGPWTSHCDSTAYENRFLFLVWRTRWTERIYSHVLLVVIPVPVSRSRVTVSNKWEVQVTNSRGLCWRVWTIESFAHPWIVAVISREVYVLSDEGKKTVSGLTYGATLKEVHKYEGVFQMYLCTKHSIYTFRIKRASAAAVTMAGQRIRTLLGKKGCTTSRANDQRSPVRLRTAGICDKPD
jgi:hypothetical protein